MKRLLTILFTLATLATFAQIKVGVPFVKNNPADNSITGYADLLAGGYHIVPNYHGRDSLINQYSTTLKTGMLCYEQNVDSTYRWSGSAWLPVIYGVDILPLNNTFTGSVNSFLKTVTIKDQTDTTHHWDMYSSGNILHIKTLDNGDILTLDDNTGTIDIPYGLTTSVITTGGFALKNTGATGNLSLSYQNISGNTSAEFPNTGLTTEHVAYQSYVLAHAGVTNVSSANADISVATGTSTPVLTLNSGSGANQIVKRDGSGNLNATTVTTNANLTGDMTSSGNVTTYNNVLPANKGGAGTVSGLLKGNGSGTVSSASAGTDYLTPSGASSTYVPLTRTLTNGVGIVTIGDLSANRTISIDTPTIATKAYSIAKFFDRQTALQSGVGKNFTSKTRITNTTPTFELMNADTTKIQATRVLTGNSFNITNNTVFVAGAGNAITLNGTTQYYTGTIASGMPSGTSVTFSCSKWFKSTTTNENLFSFGSITAGVGVVIDNSNFTIRLGGGTPGVNTFQITGAPVSGLHDGNWHLVMVVVNGSACTAYVDGISYTAATGLAYNCDLNGAFDSRNFPNAFTVYNKGVDDQLAFWTSALTSTDAAAVYNGGNGTASLPSTPSLVYNYEDGAPSTTAINSGSLGSGANLTLVNAVGWAGVGNGKVPTPSTPGISNVLQQGDGIGTSSHASTLLGDGSGETGMRGITTYLQTSDGTRPLAANSNGVMIDPNNVLMNPAITAGLQLGAGSASAGGAPLKIPAGTVLTTPEAGAIEFDGTDITYTTSGVVRRTIVNTAAAQILTNKTLTSTNVLGGVTMTLGSDANHDIYERNGGVLSRIATGGANTVFHGGNTFSNIVGGDLSSTIVLPSGATGTTQAVFTNNTTIATTAYSDRAAPIHGNLTTTGAATTVVTVTIGTTQASNGYAVAITPKDLLTAVNYYITNQTTTTFDVNFVTGLTGSINFDWILVR